MLEAMEKMDNAVEHTQSQFSTVRTGRATPSLVERITIEYYGAPVPLQQLASISVPEARQLLIKPHDRGTLEADREGDPRQRSRRGAQQRRHLDPALAAAAHRGTSAASTSRSSSTWPRRAASRSAARAEMPARRWRPPRRDGDISADELERAEKELEKVTHDHVEHIDAALGRKEQELLEV